MGALKKNKTIEALAGTVVGWEQRHHLRTNNQGSGVRLWNPWWNPTRPPITNQIKANNPISVIGGPSRRIKKPYVDVGSCVALRL